MDPPALRQHLFAAAVIAALGALMIAHAIAPGPAIEFDEPYWFGAAQVTRELVTHLAPPSRWEKAYDERSLTTFGTMNPPVGKLLLGLAPTLEGAQLVATALAALSLLAFYLLARELLGLRRLAIAAPLLLFLVPVFQFSATHVYVEMPCVFLCAASVLALARWLRTRSRAALAGSVVLVGLACATKLNAGALAAAIAVYLAAVHPGAIKERLLRLTAAVLVPPFIFLAVNPFLWPAPLARVREMLSQWALSSSLQQASDDLARLAVHGRLEAFARVVSRGLLDPLEGGEIPGWATTTLLPNISWIAGATALALVASLLFVRLRPAKHGPARWIGSLAPLLALGLVGSLVAPQYFGVAGALCLLGAWELVERARAEGAGSGAALVLTVFTVSLVATALWLPFDWARYYLPCQMWAPLFAAAGIARLGTLVSVERRRGDAGAVSSPS